MKKFNVILSIMIGMVTLLTSYADSPDQQKLDRSFTLSSGYLERVFNSNEGLSYFPLSTMQLYSKGFDTITSGSKKTPQGRLGVALLELPVSYWFAHSLFTAYHEFGHARAMAGNNRDYFYTSFGFGIRTSMSSYWDLSFMRLFTPPFGFPGSGIAGTNYVGPSKNVLSPSLNQYYGSSGLSIITSAGGLNNQTLLVKKVCDLVYENNGHITYFQHYLGNKIATYIYSKIDSNLKNLSGSDIGSVLTEYSTKGYGITHFDLEQQSLVSLLSGTTYSFLRGYYNYIKSGNPIVETAEIFGFRIPDINAYINARGLSYEFVTGYRFSPHFRLDLAYERVWKGDSTQQLTPRFHYQLASLFPQLNDFWISTEIVIGGGVGGSLEANWTPNVFNSDKFSTSLSYFTRVILYNSYTLYGERNTPSFNNKEIYPEFITGLSYKY